MIYDSTAPGDPLRQGDIFQSLPRVELSLRSMPLVDERDQALSATWAQIAAEGKTVTALLPIRPVAAIVVSQDCDAARGQDVTLCEIRPFQDVERKARDTTSAKSWKNIITQHARLNLKWFYLPPDAAIGFADKMGVDFSVTLRIPRAELEELRHLRKGRLNATADEHFRERIAEYFRRYPYDEWYPLAPQELAEYRKDYPDAPPFPWQQRAVK